MKYKYIPNKNHLNKFNYYSHSDANKKVWQNFQLQLDFFHGCFESVKINYQLYSNMLNVNSVINKIGYHFFNES